MSKKTLVSGIQPSGALHIGNYFGAMKQFVDLQDVHDEYLFVANYHALTTVKDPQALAEKTLDVAIDYLAIGLDPKKVTLYIQSDMPQVTELTWIFNTLVTVPYMERAHAFKDKTTKGIEPTMGLFDYPVLMASDILLPGADIVSVGQDQKQHVEYSRDIAQKFNNAFGETFKLPEYLILEHAAVVPGTDGQKMSKSYGNTIPLFATRDEITKAVMSIVTDSSGDIPVNVYNIHKFFRTESELNDLYEANKGSYKTLKEALIEDIDAFIAPIRERRAEIAKDKDAVIAMLKENGEKVRARAEKVMEDVRRKTGLFIEA
ncbi:MAG: tryptophan--tRNA ligase [Candidatus Pacebacteria bacterium]|nr:tryptophan--tRNA ligase [Candidatus Paceibacterota bacterium]